MSAVIQVEFVELMSMEISVVILSVLTIMSALGVVLSRSVLHSALYLTLTFILLAGHYAMLDAHFVALLQVLVYAGAIMVLVVFVILLLGAGEVEVLSRGKVGYSLSLLQKIACVLASGLLVVVCFLSVYGDFMNIPSIVFSDITPGFAKNFGSAKAFGQLLFGDYVLHFEVISLILLVGFVGAIILAQEEKRVLPAHRGLSAMHRNMDSSVEAGAKTSAGSNVEASIETSVEARAASSD